MAKSFDFFSVEVVLWGVHDLSSVFGGVLTDESSVGWVVLAVSSINSMGVWEVTGVFFGNLVNPFVHILWADWVSLLLMLHLVVESGVGTSDWSFEHGDFLWTSCNDSGCWLWVTLLVELMKLTVVGSSVSSVWSLKDRYFLSLIIDGLITWWGGLSIICSSISSVWSLKNRDFFSLIVDGLITCW